MAKAHNEKLDDAMDRWRQLPRRRRWNVVSYYLNEIKEQRGEMYAGDPFAADWVEENQIVIDILQAIKEVRPPARKRKKGK